MSEEIKVEEIVEESEKIEEPLIESTGEVSDISEKSEKSDTIDEVIEEVKEDAKPEVKEEQKPKRRGRPRKSEANKSESAAKQKIFNKPTVLYATLQCDKPKAKITGLFTELEEGKTYIKGSVVIGGVGKVIGYIRK